MQVGGGGPEAEDEEAKPTLVKVAGCPSMSVLGLTAATGWGGVCYVPFDTPSHAIKERTGRW